MSNKLILPISLLACLVSSAAFAGGFASIAYNGHTHHWGEDHGAPTLELSKFRALAACGANCEIASWVHDGYVALADGPNGWGAATSGFSREEAENRALANCSARSTGCHIAVWAASH